MASLWPGGDDTAQLALYRMWWCKRCVEIRSSAKAMAEPRSRRIRLRLKFGHVDEQLVLSLCKMSSMHRTMGFKLLNDYSLGGRRGLNFDMTRTKQELVEEGYVHVEMQEIREESHLACENEKAGGDGK